MDFRMTIEWDYESGISPDKVISFLDEIENLIRSKHYGTSVSSIWVVLICRPYDFKQRKRYKKDIGRFEYDILLDYFLIKNVMMEEKKGIIQRQIVELTEQTFSKYKFEDFNKSVFLSDLKEIVNAIKW